MGGHIKPSVCGSNVALSEITLSTCFTSISNTREIISVCPFTTLSIHHSFTPRLQLTMFHKYFPTTDCLLPSALFPQSATPTASSILHSFWFHFFFITCIFIGGIAQSARRRYLIYTEADFEVFRPAGATRCTDGGEIWHGGGGPSSTPNFTPIDATVKV